MLQKRRGIIKTVTENYEVTSGILTKINNDNIKEIVIPKNVFLIKNGIFDKCKYLEKVEFTNEVVMHDKNIFDKCSSLNKIILSDFFIPNISDMIMNKVNIFLKKENYLEQINVYINDYTNNMEYVKKIMYKLINDIIKDDYDTFNKKVMTSSNIICLIDQIIHKEKESDIKLDLDKFKALFQKTRYDEFIDIEIFNQMSLSDASKFNLKIYRKLLNQKIMGSLKNRSLVLYNLIKFFGLFEKNKNLQNRLNYVLKMLEPNNYDLFIDNYTMEDLMAYYDYNYDILSFFHEKLELYYVLKIDKNIPLEINHLINNRISKKNLDKLLKLYPKNIREKYENIILENYDLKNICTYKVKSNLNERHRNVLSEFMLPINSSGIIFDESIFCEIFISVDNPFNENAYNFLKENLDKFKNKIGYINLLKKLLKDFSVFENNYDNTSYINYLNYINNVEFKPKEGYENFAKEVKKSGVIDEKTYKIYEELYIEAVKRKYNCLPKIPETTFEINGYNFSVELLAMDDPFLIYMSESNYFENCRVYGNNAYSCLKHLALSNDSRAFIVKMIMPNGEKKLVAQSFLWQNENILCFDNVEFHRSVLSKNRVKESVMHIYQMWSQILIYLCNDLLREKINKDLDNIDMSNVNDAINMLKESKIILSKQIIKSVVLGKNKDNFPSKYFKELNISDIRPKNYDGWTDTKKVLSLAGSSNIEIPDNEYKQKTMYSEDDKVIVRINKKN